MGCSGLACDAIPTSFYFLSEVGGKFFSWKQEEVGGEDGSEGD